MWLSSGFVMWALNIVRLGKPYLPKSSNLVHPYSESGVFERVMWVGNVGVNAGRNVVLTGTHLTQDTMSYLLDLLAVLS